MLKNRTTKSIRGVRPSELVIGGLTISSIASAMNGKIFRIGRVWPTNAFCICVNNFHYLYVSCAYTGYRSLAKRLFNSIPVGYDVDHVLAKKLALKLGCKYILLAKVIDSVNRSNGSTEKLGLKNMRKINLSKVVYPDERIYYKIYSEKIQHGHDKTNIGFDPANIFIKKIELRYGHVWNVAFGFHESTPLSFIASLSPLTPHVKL